MVQAAEAGKGKAEYNEAVVVDGQPCWRRAAAVLCGSCLPIRSSDVVNEAMGRVCVELVAGLHEHKTEGWTGIRTGAWARAPLGKGGCFAALEISQEARRSLLTPWLSWVHAFVRYGQWPGEMSTRNAAWRNGEGSGGRGGTEGSLLLRSRNWGQGDAGAAGAAGCAVGVSCAGPLAAAAVARCRGAVLK